MATFKPFCLGKLVIDHPLVMGILNATPDSFYAASRCDSEAALEARVRQLVDERADIIDIGACSTRPGAASVDAAEEMARLDRAMRCVKRLAPAVTTSVDTFRADVARHAVEQLGVDIINDISGGTLDARMPATVARLRVPYVLMHLRGTPATMQRLTDYADVTGEVIADLRGKMATLRGMGVRDVIVDPGFGFAKTLRQNYELMARLEDFHTLEAPLLVGISRKSMIYHLLGTDPERSLNGTTALNTVALLAGAHILRVHDVAAAVEARAIVGQLAQAQNPD